MDKRKPFDTARPEEVGVSSDLILEYIDNLEKSQTEMHGLMIMRHNKMITEGWWAPFAPNLRHGLQSHTKTYAATVVGIAYTEGILKLDERLIDIFPDESPEDPSENLKLLTIRDVLCMGCGMDTMPFNSKDWIREFMHTPVNHKPGTTYMYNSTGSTMLGAIVRKKTGLGLFDYLKPRLFDKIGINYDNLRCMCMADGMEVGGGGMFATTEDNFRLMKLYADGGVWEGERILAEDYVQLATTNQNDSATESINNPEASDNFLGYGFQIWMCKPHRAYRADGAMGQFTIVLPDQDMEIAITETAVGAHWAQSTLDITWDFIEKIKGDEVLAQDDEAYDRLCRKLSRLNVGNPECQPFSPLVKEISGKTYELTSGVFTPFGGNFMIGTRPDSIKTFRFDFDDYGFVWDITTEKGRNEKIRFATSGSRFSNLLGNREDMTQLYLGDAYWKEDNVLVMHGRWVETCLTDVYTLTFEGDGIKIETDNNSAWKFPKQEEITAREKK
ncbi:MAG: serine hydrolase [Erysipelotrichaceae bacterium]|nr:serine hydrolase [Erysipelotrichaceae bacterium]